MPERLRRVATTVLTSRFSDATADMHPLCSKRRIPHALGIGGKVVNRFFWHTATGVSTQTVFRQFGTRTTPFCLLVNTAVFVCRLFKGEPCTISSQSPLGHLESFVSDLFPRADRA
jgi:hypothetical protein